MRQHRVASLRLIAAAVKPNPLVERLLHGYRPLGRTIEYRTYPHLRLGKSSGAEASAVLRKVLVETLHRDQGGLLITYGDRLSRSDFTDVRANGVPLRILEMNAIVLPARASAASSPQPRPSTSRPGSR